MSQIRRADHDPEAHVLVRTYAITHLPSLSIAPRQMDWHQLAYASSGVMTVGTAHGTWVVPPHRAVWIPAGVRHEVEMFGRVSVRTVFFKTSITRNTPTRCLAVNVSPLLRELVLRAMRLNVLRDNIASQRRLAHVMLDQIDTLEAAPLQLPWPRDHRGRRTAELLVTHPNRDWGLDEVSRQAGASKRSLERVFRRETGMTLGRWRQRARLIHSLRLVASDQPVTQVALAVGYRSPSAYVSAFRRTLGATPGRYFDMERQPGVTSP